MRTEEQKLDKLATQENGAIYVGTVQPSFASNNALFMDTSNGDLYRNYGHGTANWILINTSAGSYTLPTPTSGAILVGTTTGWVSVPIGTSGDVLTVSAGTAMWAAPTPAGVGSIDGVSPNTSGGNVDLVGTSPIVITPDNATDTITISHANSGATPATYTYATVTINAGGHITSASSGVAPITAHSGLSGLTSGDDHTQYFKLTGRTVSQVASGSDAASGTLTLKSTTNATTGVIYAGMTNGEKVSIGESSPNAKLSIHGNQSSDAYVAFQIITKTGYSYISLVPNDTSVPASGLNVEGGQIAVKKTNSANFSELRYYTGSSYGWTQASVPSSTYAARQTSNLTDGQYHDFSDRVGTRYRYNSSATRWESVQIFDGDLESRNQFLQPITIAGTYYFDQALVFDANGTGTLALATSISLFTGGSAHNASNYITFSPLLAGAGGSTTLTGTGHNNSSTATTANVQYDFLQSYNQASAGVRSRLQMAVANNNSPPSCFFWLKFYYKLIA